MDPDYCALDHDIPEDPPEQTTPIHIESDMPVQSQDYTETQFRSNNYSSEDMTPESGENRASSSTDHSAPRERNENNATTNAPTAPEESSPAQAQTVPQQQGKKKTRLRPAHNRVPLHNKSQKKTGPAQAETTPQKQGEKTRLRQAHNRVALHNKSQKETDI